MSEYLRRLMGVFGSLPPRKPKHVDRLAEGRRSRYTRHREGKAKRESYRRFWRRYQGKGSRKVRRAGAHELWRLMRYR